MVNRTAEIVKYWEDLLVSDCIDDSEEILEKALIDIPILIGEIRILENGRRST